MVAIPHNVRVQTTDGAWIPVDLVHAGRRNGVDHWELAWWPRGNPVQWAADYMPDGAVFHYRLRRWP